MKYRLYKDSRWVDTGKKCERDGQTIYVEVLNNGTKTDNYCCGRDGCTKQDYKEIKTFNI